MEFAHAALPLALGAGFFMAFSLGANDVANAMATCVGARALTVRRALAMAAALNLAGAVLLGGHVTATLSCGLVALERIGDPGLVMCGMLSALLAASVWVLAATLAGLPVSSTHAIVGALAGFGLAAGGAAAVNWPLLAGVVLSWVVSPFLAAAMAYLIFRLLRGEVLTGAPDMLLKAAQWGPGWMGLTVALVVFSLAWKTPLGREADLPWPLLAAISLLAGAAAWRLSRHAALRLARRLQANESGAEEMFRRMQIFTSCYVAFSQGANDVANAVGPIAAVIALASGGAEVVGMEAPAWLLAFGGLGIASGIFALGRRVMVTMGERITRLTNTRGFAVEFAEATTVLLASKLGLPVSTTHAAVGGVTGVGLVEGVRAVDFHVLLRIAVSWVLTLPVSALLAALLHPILKDALVR